MKHIVTTGIILNRINYGEADRILTIITPDNGKVRAIAKGVRKEKSKLAGGIELFSVSNITYIPGKRDIATLVSTRLIKHYGNIVKNLARTSSAYEVLKTIDKATEDECEPEYFMLVKTALEALDSELSEQLVDVWFAMNLLKLLGHEPNLRTNNLDQPLVAAKKYNFDFDAMAFFEAERGGYSDKHIKLMRLLLMHQPAKLMAVNDVIKIAQTIKTLIKPILSQSVQL
jgi:DNA repair protein RecO (recombination protein O)